jgi:hypothetical protein
MSRQRTLIVDRMILRLPRGASANPRSIARQIGLALAARDVAESQARLAAVAEPPRHGEAASAFARRVARTVATVAERGGRDGG